MYTEYCAGRDRRGIAALAIIAAGSLSRSSRNSPLVVNEERSPNEEQERDDYRIAFRTRERVLQDGAFRNMFTSGALA